MIRRGSEWSEQLLQLHRFRRERGLLFVQLAPLLVTLEAATLGADAPDWAHPVQLLAAAAFALAGLALTVAPRLARATAAMALVAGLCPIAPLALTRPELVLIACCGLWLVASLVFAEPPPTDASLHPGTQPEHTARVAGGLALAVWFIQVLVLPTETTDGAALTCTALLLAIALGLRWAFIGEARGWTRWLVPPAALLSLLGAWLLREQPSWALSALAFGPAAGLLLVRIESDERGPLDRIVEHPARLLVVTFLGLCVLATAMLALPHASATGHSVGLLDAAFTATSAVCVTGLAVLDTQHDFSFLGQAMIFVSFQIGGLGIMTFYTVAFAGLGRRLSLRHERAVAGAMNVEDRRLLVGSLRRVLLLTGGSELLGGLALFGAFVHEGEALPTAAWRAAFTAVSAFCNAGFALQSDSLVSYADNPVVLYTVAALIVVGGLSPIGVVALPRWVRGRRVSLQATLILVTAAALLAFGAVAFGLLEWTQSLGDLSWGDRVHNAIFQSVTLRTAGFNSVDLAVTRPATQTLMLVLMFIGASPGGTGGGIKTTTVAVIVLMIAATLRGRARTEAFGRRIGERTIYKAGAVIMVGLVAGFVALLALQLTQDIGLEVALFEVVSALGTVGLSIGGTAMLDPIGKIVVMACMFAGRVGPLTLFLFLGERQHEAPIGLPEAEVDVG